MLAHKGMEEGVMVAELIAGQAGHVNYDIIPWVIYTQPGNRLGRQDRDPTQERGQSNIVPARFPSWPTAGRSGRVIPLASSRCSPARRPIRILGVHIIGTAASELIAEAVVAMEFGASAEDLARICHAHPSLSEVMHEAALAVDKRPLHF